MYFGHRFKLPVESPLPLRDQVCEIISEAAARNAIVHGQPLPSCRELSTQLGVSRNTVFSAYDRLVEIGLLISKDRSGYFLNPDSVTMAPRTGPDAGAAALAIENRLPAQGARASDLRKVEHPDDWNRFPYPFIYNQIDPRIFPIQGWRECMRLALNRQRLSVWSGDSDGADSLNLIKQLQRRLLSYRGIQAATDEILITAGAQNALFILGLLFAGKCGSVAMEDPGYPEARSALTLTGNQIVGVAVDDQGLMVDAIPDECGMVYTTPSHQFPTTATMSMKRRQQVLNIARDRQMVIIEDDYEAEMNYQRDTLPPIKAIDDSGSVVYVGSLSKTLSPGLRLGFIVAHPTIIKEAKAIRRAMMRHPPTLMQDAMANFMALGHHDAHLRRLHRRYKARWGAMRESISQHLPDLAMGQSNGGTCFWVDGPSNLDTNKLEENLRARGVLFDKGSVFYIDPERGREKFRLGFASMPLKSLDPGIRIIAEEIDKLL